MNMTDMLLQMTLQSTWQMSQATQSANQTTNAQDQQGGTSFQDLLDQRREDMTQTGKENINLKEPQGNQDAGTAGKTDKDLQNAELAAAVIAPVMVDNVIPATAIEAAEAGVVETPVVQAVNVEAVLPTVQTVQTVQPQTQTQQPSQSEPGIQQPQVTVPEAQAAEVSAPQSRETVPQSADTQSGTQEDMAQDMTQSAPAQNENDELKDVTVESFQTPLFQNVEATPVRVGDGEPVDMTAPAQEVDQSLGDVLKSALDQGEQHLEIKLSPANLGTVTAEFTRTPEGVLHVVLHAETEQTARLLSDHASSLGLILQDNTRSEVRIQVAQPQENQSAWQHPDQDGGQQQQQQSHQQQQRNTPRQEAETFLHQLRLGLVQRETDAV